MLPENWSCEWIEEEIAALRVTLADERDAAMARLVEIFAETVDAEPRP